MHKLDTSVPSQIQQAVHGYSEGHRLLASSVRLPKDADRQVLILSDLSGSSGGEQFDPYLTGYPVFSAGYYALARTWPAPEMHRPGCVWTHTLLIPSDLLGGLIRPDLLLQLFQRPSPGADFSAYQNSLPLPREFQEPSPSAGEGEGIAPSLAEGLLRALYDSPDPRTVLTVPRYSLADGPLLSIWRLQWPSLRRRFTFCGGSRGPRSLDGEPFILQATLERDSRRLERGPTPPRTVPWTAISGSAAEAWVRDAAEACTEPTRNTLHEFMNRIGEGLPGDTTLFRPVVQAHVVLRERSRPDTVSRLLELIAETYPGSTEGREYKLSFLSAGNPAGLSDIDVLRGLASTKQHAAFDEESLDLGSRSSALWASNGEAFSLLVELLSAPHNPLAETILRELTRAIPVDALGQLLDTPAEVVAGAITRNTTLADSAAFWDQRPQHQARAAAALAICRDTFASSAVGIIQAALNANADPISPSLIDVFGPASIPTVMDWVDADARHPDRLLSGWRTALAIHQSELLGWLNARAAVRPETAQLVFSLIRGGTLASDPAGLVAFARHAPQAGAAAEGVLIPLAGHLLRKAFSSDPSRAIELAAASLDHVYRAAGAARLPDAVWYDLTPFLPDGYLWSWDRCYRLRAAIAEKFRSGEWPADKLPDVTRDDGIFREIVAILKERRSGRRVLADAARSASATSRRELMLSE